APSSVPSPAEPRPSRQAERHPAPTPTARPARPVRSTTPQPAKPSPAPRTKAGAIADSRTDSRTDARSGSSRQQREIERALRADRQLAAMLRTTSPATSPVMQWFGGAPWTLPVGAYHLTARFGQSGSLWSSTHTGLDFAAPTGTPVRAATAGTVTSVGWAGAYGNKIEITHPDGTETWYAHLSRTAVRVGSQVSTGAVIGAVGATGNVTGAHLHFEVRLADGSAVDPDATLRQHGLRP
ncbi:peptidoglycan DD-metalloendopeptidase family protein, partial [Nocardioides sp.]|uniref:peptidoglycan DD-metalloendopeptidase family protein n=1 Tax=Nocardioides sp. TaxID=35761 RepID=UPI002ED83A04